MSSAYEDLLVSLNVTCVPYDVPRFCAIDQAAKKVLFHMLGMSLSGRQLFPREWHELLIERARQRRLARLKARRRQKAGHR